MDMTRSRFIGAICVAAILATMLLVGGCRKGSQNPAESRNVMGTTVTITVYDADIKLKDVQPLFNEMFKLMADWEKRVLKPGPDNQVSGISKGAGTQSIPTDPDVFAMLMQGLRLYDMTGKVFDIRYGPMLDLWGIDSKPRVPSPAELDSMKPLVADGGMFVAGNSILLAKKGMRFDAREMAIGYIFDIVATKMAEKGLRTVTICSPTMCRAIGDPPDKRGFKVSFSNPLDASKPWATVYAPVGGVAYASLGSSGFQAGGKTYSRMIDPRTGLPAKTCSGVIVQAPDAASAQAYAYSMFVLGGTDGLTTEGRQQVGGYVLARDENGKLAVLKNGSLNSRFEAQ
jgi:FAD:protein FMN transferase